MSETPPPSPPPQEPSPAPAKPMRKTPLWVKLLLAASLILNLAVVGAVCGALLRMKDASPLPSSRIQSLTFGPFSDALPKSQRLELSRSFMGKGQDPRAIRDNIRKDRDETIMALKKMPFDAQEFAKVLQRQSDRMMVQSKAGRDALVAVVSAMSDEERLVFAARLERDGFGHAYHEKKR